MTVAVTLHLPESLVEQAKRRGGATHQPLEEVLADALAMMAPLLEDTPEALSSTSIATLSDAEILHLAQGTMDTEQNQRLGILQAKGKALGLSAEEGYELLALLHIYQLGQLRKSAALAEAVRRGLQPPLSV
jgi:hypothetical protein